VARALAAADVVAVPSVRDRAGNVDGLPNVLLEALAAGRPVVASRVAGIPDVVRDGLNGLLVPARDPEALATALLRLRREPETRTRLGAAARRYAETTLTWGAAVRAFEEAYAEAAALDAR
jgi:glycosyltransferase involved in cell wall biosynthesis